MVEKAIDWAICKIRGNQCARLELPDVLKKLQWIRVRVSICRSSAWHSKAGNLLSEIETSKYGIRSHFSMVDLVLQKLK
jgi:hypothetical protein